MYMPKHAPTLDEVSTLLVPGRNDDSLVDVEDGHSKSVPSKLPHLPASTWSALHPLVEDLLHDEVLDNLQALLGRVDVAHLHHSPPRWVRSEATSATLQSTPL